jgi:hypothetical protein
MAYPKARNTGFFGGATLSPRELGRARLEESDLLRADNELVLLKAVFEL